MPYLERSEHAAIVGLSSAGAINTSGHTRAYGGLKAALINYLSQLSTNLGPQGIRVNTVSPGAIFFEGGVWDKRKREQPQGTRKEPEPETEAARRAADKAAEQVEIKIKEAKAKLAKAQAKAEKGAAAQKAAEAEAALKRRFAIIQTWRSIAPVVEPGRLSTRACPRVPATARDRRPSGWTSRMASASPGAWKYCK